MSGLIWMLLILCFNASGCVQEAYAQAGFPLTYYSPGVNLEKADTMMLDSATRTIDLAAFSLTDAAIVQSLVSRAQAGVKIRIYLDRGELQAECRSDVTCARIPLHDLIGLPGVEIRVKYSKVLMHLKSYEVDSRMLRDGSANFSEQGESRQDNSAIFSSDLAALGAFSKQFTEMWGRSNNLTVAQAVDVGATKQATPAAADAPPE